MRHPGIWEQDGVIWVALRAMPATVRSYWPANRASRGTGRSTIKGLAHSGAIHTVQEPPGSRRWSGYDGEPVTVVASLMHDMYTHCASVDGWRCRHAVEEMGPRRWGTSSGSTGEMRLNHWPGSSTIQVPDYDAATSDPFAVAPRPPGGWKVGL